jgi:glucose/mannose-6-phosphate isomerase
MLDSKDAIRSVDTHDMLAAVENLPKQLQEGMRRGMRASVAKAPVTNVVVCGVGGSAIGGDLLRGWLSTASTMRCEVQRSYSLPAQVGKDTVAIVASYSGDTEETLAMFKDARRRRAKIVAVSSGGRLSKLAVSGHVPLVKIPKGVQPRASLGYLFGAMAGILESCGVVAPESQVKETASILGKVNASCKPSAPTVKNEAKILAHRLLPSVPIVIGHGLSSPVAKRWANQFNENSKVLSFSSALPEFDHNEIVGWMRDPRTRGFSSVFLHHGTDKMMARRIVATREMLARVAPVCEVSAVGRSPMAKMFSLVMLGDYVSTYLGILRNEDPSANEPIDELKTALSKK